MTTVAAYMNEDVYAKQNSNYAIEVEKGQFFGFSNFANQVESQVYPDKPAYDEAQLAIDQKLLKSSGLGIMKLPDPPRDHQRNKEFPIQNGRRQPVEAFARRAWRWLPWISHILPT